MKKILALALAAATSASFAGSFDGPYVQAALGGASTQTETTYSLLGATGNPKPSGGSFLGQILGGYSQSFDRFNLAGNIFYNIGNQDASSYTGSANTSVANVTVSGTQSFTMKNTWGVSLEPGAYLADKTLGYLKLSYYNSQLNYNATITARNSVTGATASASANASNSVNGIGYGLGVKQMFTDNIFGVVEYQYVQYDKWSDGDLSYKPNQNYGWVGVGYKF